MKRYAISGKRKNITLKRVLLATFFFLFFFSSSLVILFNLHRVPIVGDILFSQKKQTPQEELNKTDIIGTEISNANTSGGSGGSSGSEGSGISGQGSNYDSENEIILVKNIPQKIGTVIIDGGETSIIE